MVGGRRHVHDGELDRSEFRARGNPLYHELRRGPGATRRRFSDDGDPRILLADDHTLLLDAFKALLAPEFDVVGTVTDGRMLLEACVASTRTSSC